ncbi:MAG: LLM class flavin-dependent oxidoreductase [Anaerolineales bacterium]|nr:LLM class flavin-dependent oxidoreductase [Anaerolineales bacterium]
MFTSGIMLVPKGPLSDVIGAAQAAEAGGFDFCLIADEGFLYDVYAVMALVLANTQRLRVAPITNPFTRHPAVTAVGLATLNTLAPGRAFLTVVPGGSLVLKPMRLPGAKPLTACRDLITIVRALSTGEKQSHTGAQFGLDDAQIHVHAEPVSIWGMGRGPKMIRLSGECADVTVITGKLGGPTALTEAQAGAALSARPLALAYLGSLAFDPQMIDQMRPHYAYVLPDTPTPVLHRLGLSAEWVAALKRTRETQGTDAAARLIGDDLLRRLTVAGTPDECVADLVRLAQLEHYRHFIFPVMSLEPEYALPLIRRAGEIYGRARRLAQEEPNA